MGKYSKAWGAFFGSVIGLGVAYGLIPDGLGSNIDTVLQALLPTVGGVIGTWRAPKNTN
jgi:hypothetical protein